MRVTEKFQRTKLDTGRLKAMIENASNIGVKSISFTGGEPLMFMDDLVDVLNFAGMVNIPLVRTGTNGFIFMGHDKPDFEDKIRTIAYRLKDSALNTFWISLDSWNPEIHEEMRGLPGVVEGIRKALPIFHENGIFPSANLGLNRAVMAERMAFSEEEGYYDRFYESFREGIGKFYGFAKDLGFTIVNACYPMSGEEDAVYKAESEDDVVAFNIKEKRLIYKALYDTIPKFRSDLRIFTPLSSLYLLMKEAEGEKPVYPCRGGVDFFFVDSNKGHTYPCGYRGKDDFGKFEDFQFKYADKKAFCTECDWECFRDPTALIQPLIDIPRRPHKAIARLFTDFKFYRLWMRDLSYYKACGFFNCRTAPDGVKMNRFKLEPAFG